jgi:hypothetical protein
MVLDVPSLPFHNTSSSSPSDNGDEDNDELTVNLDKPWKKGLGQLHIDHLLEMVLQDALTILFFKAQSAIQSDIQYYTPKGEDLAYPDKIIGKWYFIHMTLSENAVLTILFPSCQETRPDSRPRRRRSASFSSCLFWINRRCDS